MRAWWQSAARSRRWLLGLALAAVLPGLALLLDRLCPPDLHRLDDVSVVLLGGDGRLLNAALNREGLWRLPLSDWQVDPLYLRMLRAYEDQRFDHHPGVDPLAVLRALGQALRHGRVVSGASTLTMQVVRLLEPRPRTLTSKGIEVLRALQLEWRYDKPTILSMYLALAPYGGNLESVRAASLAYLGKEPVQLTPAQAALLVALPQSPSRLRPDRYPERARAARAKVLARMARLGVLTPQQVAEAATEPVPQVRRALPALAPHLALRLRREAPDTGVHASFIRDELQRALERLAAQERGRLDPRASLGVLVVQNRTRRVLAYLGSAGFLQFERAGQVDMVQAVRSPGSTLKPLVYGLGFGDLIIHPETLVADVPTRFGDYSPSNFLHVFHGELSVREALQRSLNVPAVAVLQRVGPVRFAARLREAGVALQLATEQAEPGLPLVLGGVGLKLEDLVRLYAGIATGGLIAPLHYGATEPEVAGERLLSPVACWYLQRILEGTPPPEGIVPAVETRRPRAIAFKTGTSYGFRDAWAIGFDADHTVGVWVGRPDGTPSPGRLGRDTAAPLLFRVFDLLPPPGLPAPAPDGVLQRAWAELPARLQRLDADLGPARSSAPLVLSFPVHGSTLELPRLAGRLADLPLVASGGAKPLQWLVNGVPLAASPRSREAAWAPDGEGFARITVIDRDGRSASAEVQLRATGG